MVYTEYHLTAHKKDVSKCITRCWTKKNIGRYPAKMDSLMLTFIATGAALLFGYITQRAYGQPPSSERVSRGSAKIKHVLVLYVTPIVLLLSFWTLRLELWMITMPFLGVGAHLLGGFLGYLAGRLLHLGKPQVGSMFAAGMMSNLNSFGGLVSVLMFGEPGFALGAVYRIFEPIVMYGVGFPVSAALGERGTSQSRLSIRRALLDPYVVWPNIGLIAGVLLNAAGVHRPALLRQWGPGLVICSSLLMAFAIGLTFRPARMRSYWVPSAAVAAIKFLAVPAAVAFGAYALGYHRMDNGLPFKISLLMAMMPVAFNALIPPALFRLDLDLANSSWLLTTVVFLLLLPVLYLLLV